MLYIIFYGDLTNVSNINQTVNYNQIDDNIMTTVKEIISELETYRMDNEIINTLKEYTSNNKKNALIDYLVSLTANLSSGVIGFVVKGILLSYGIPIA